MARVLVTGGCGYIGSHTIVSLLESGHEVTCLDNLVNSDTNSLAGIEEITGVRLPNHEIDLRNAPDLDTFIASKKFDSIIHFAALKSVGESVEKPLLYHENNIVGLINLLRCQAKFHIPNFIFSSSCSVYGNADRLPVTENTPLAEAESPYARTKQICEQIIFDVSQGGADLNFIILRYFNPAGAHKSIKIGESARNVANNLVPVITETGIGKREGLKVFGHDYPTRDGTCIRDFIHIMDLAQAHRDSLHYLLEEKNKNSVEIFNLGSGSGTTVLEAIHAFEAVSGKKLNYKMVNRRAGDVVAVYADYSKAKKDLGWEPQLGIKDIMDTAWKWEQMRSA